MTWRHINLLLSSQIQGDEIRIAGEGLKEMQKSYGRYGFLGFVEITVSRHALHVIRDLLGVQSKCSH